MEVETPPVGSMLAHFSLLGAFFSLVAASCAFVGRFLPILIVFFAFWVALNSILGGPGQVLEPSKPHFWLLVGVSKHTLQKCSSCNETTVFAMFYRLRNMSHTATKCIFCMAFKAFLDTVQ